MSDPLDELSDLDRSLLHVFVAGPGLGEGIAVALPGCGWLLARRPAVMLTALPTRRDQQPVHAHPAQLRRREYRALVEAPTDTGFAAGAIDARPMLIVDELAPIWTTAFDDQGGISGSWRGHMAMEIVA